MVLFAFCCPPPFKAAARPRHWTDSSSSCEEQKWHSTWDVTPTPDPTHRHHAPTRHQHHHSSTRGRGALGPEDRALRGRGVLWETSGRHLGIHLRDILDPFGTATLPPVGVGCPCHRGLDTAVYSLFTHMQETGSFLFILFNPLGGCVWHWPHVYP